MVNQLRVSSIILWMTSPLIKLSSSESVYMSWQINTKYTLTSDSLAGDDGVPASWRNRD